MRGWCAGGRLSREDLGKFFLCLSSGTAEGTSPHQVGEVPTSNPALDHTPHWTSPLGKVTWRRTLCCLLEQVLCLWGLSFPLVQNNSC